MCRHNARFRELGAFYNAWMIHLSGISLDHIFHVRKSSRVHSGPRYNVDTRRWAWEFMQVFTCPCFFIYREFTLPIACTNYACALGRYQADFKDV